VYQSGVRKITGRATLPDTTVYKSQYSGQKINKTPQYESRDDAIYIGERRITTDMGKTRTLYFQMLLSSLRKCKGVSQGLFYPVNSMYE